MDEQRTTFVSDSATQRRSDRIRYAYNLRVSVQDSSGQSLDGAARTEVITRDGGLMVTSLPLSTGSLARIYRSDSKHAEIKIVGQVGIRNEEYLYGFQFTEPVHDFWDLKFPALYPGSGVAKLVLQCSRCSRQEVMHLGETELMVYESMRVIPHRCDHCGIETLWIEPLVLGDNGVIVGSGSYEVQANLQPRRSRTINDRKFNRIAMKNVKACLHRSGFADDVVSVIDLSRGGIRFLSLVDYQPGTVLEVAVPYTEGTANVFTPAKIARVKCRPTADIPGDFGLQYIKT